MVNDAHQLPGNVEELRHLLTERDQMLAERDSRIRILEEALRLAKAQLYGRSTEKHFCPDARQQELIFDEIEELAVAPAPEEPASPVKAHSRRRGGGRKALPKTLPRIDVLHDLNDAEKNCACGAELKQIGKEISEQLDYVPAKAQVIRHIRPKYACPCCEGADSCEPSVKIAPLPPQLLPKSIATSGLLAHIVVSKFVDGLPLYRQSKMYNRIGVDLDGGKMSRWLIKVAEKCEPLKTLLEKQILKSPVIGVDETRLQVLKEPKRKDTSQSYAWVIRSLHHDNPGTLFMYSPTRQASFITAVLKDYCGAMITDGYSAYIDFGKGDSINHACCWAHTRRKYTDVLKGLSNKKRKKGSLVEQALKYIGKLYKIEKVARDKRPEERLRLRQDLSQPVLKEFHTWLKENQHRTPPKGALGLAMAYTLNYWLQLNVYTQDPMIPIDNNLTENSIRPFVIGRKNWLCVSRRSTHDDIMKVAA